MSRASITIGGIDLNLREEAAPKRNSPQDPFNLAILGNFSGNTDPSSLRLIDIDRDNFDQVLERISPSITIGNGGDAGFSFDISFSTLDDFEPDELFQRLEVFDRLRDIRRRLQQPATFAAAAAELGYIGETEKHLEPEQNSNDNGADILDAVISKTPLKVSMADELESYIKQIVAPYAIPAAHPKTEDLVSQVDTAIAEQMKQILHDAQFQELESNWRAAFLLVRRLETSSKLHIQLLDIDKQSLVVDLSNDYSRVHKLFVTNSTVPGAQTVSLIAGLYSFEHSLADIGSLCKLGRIAQAAGCSFVAAANNNFIHDGELVKTHDNDDWSSEWESDEEVAWEALREKACASHVSLILPRYLARLPYGKKTTPVSSFNFEEADEVFSENDFLWSPASTLAALVCGNAFETQGWDMQIPPVTDIGGLPVFHYHDEYGDSCNLSCAETALTERGGNHIRDLGLSSLWWVMDSDQVQLVLRSLSSNDGRLLGPWNT